MVCPTKAFQFWDIYIDLSQSSSLLHCKCSNNSSFKWKKIKIIFSAQASPEGAGVLSLGWYSVYLLFETVMTYRSTFHVYSCTPYGLKREHRSTSIIRKEQPAGNCGSMAIERTCLSSLFCLLPSDLSVLGSSSIPMPPGKGILGDFGYIFPSYPHTCLDDMI